MHPRRSHVRDSFFLHPFFHSLVAHIVGTCSTITSYMVHNLCSNGYVSCVCWNCLSAASVLISFFKRIYTDLTTLVYIFPKILANGCVHLRTSHTTLICSCKYVDSWNRADSHQRPYSLTDAQADSDQCSCLVFEWQRTPSSWCCCWQ